MVNLSFYRIDICFLNSFHSHIHFCHVPVSGLFFCVGVFYETNIFVPSLFSCYGISELNLYIGITLSDYNIALGTGKNKMEICTN